MKILKNCRRTGCQITDKQRAQKGTKRTSPGRQHPPPAAPKSAGFWLSGKILAPRGGSDFGAQGWFMGSFWRFLARSSRMKGKIPPSPAPQAVLGPILCGFGAALGFKMGSKSDQNQSQERSCCRCKNLLKTLSAHPACRV